MDITLTWGDACTVEPDEDGALAVRIQNTAFVEGPRWLGCEVVGGDRERYINELIWALEKLRDARGEK